MDCSGLNDCSEVAMDPLQTLQEGLTTMELELILQIRTVADAGVGIKAIARQLDLAPNTVRRYLRGADPGPHPRPNARRLSLELVQLAQHLYRIVASGNAVVVQQELTARGLVAPLRSLQRVLEPLRRDDQVQSLATVRFDRAGTTTPIRPRTREPRIGTSPARAVNSWKRPTPAAG